MKASPPALALLIPIAFMLAQPSNADLQLHWKLDEASGTIAADSSGNALDGLWQGGAGAPSWVPGGGIDGGSVALSAAGLNAFDSFITSSFSAVGGTPLTMSAWVKTTSTGNNATAYLGNGAAGNEYYVVRVQGGVGKANARNPAEIQGPGITPINDGAWHLVTGVYASPTERRIYIDGVLENTITDEVPEVTLTRFGIGALTRNDPYNPADPFDGEIDDAAVWDRAFSNVDAAALNGLGALGAGNAADLDPLVEAFAVQGTATISGRVWDYATGLFGGFGATGGSVAGIDAFIVLDDVGNGMRMGTAPGKPIINSYGATPPTIFLGETAILAWDIDGADSVMIDQGIGVVDSASGSIEVVPTETTTYTLTATNVAGSTIPQATVTVIPEPLIVSFSASPGTIAAGDEVTLSWEVQNFTTLAIDQMVGVVTGATGSVVVTPTESTTYTFSAMNPNGMATAMADVKVLPTRELLIHWSLDEDSGTVATDSSGNAADGDWQGTTGTPGWMPAGGLVGGSVNFSGANADSFIVSTDLVSATPFTISLWMKTTSAENDGLGYLGNGDTGSSYNVVRMQGNVARVNARNTAEIQGAGTTAVNDDTWHHVVGVYRADDERMLYVDGALEASNTTLVNPMDLNRFGIGALTRNTPYNPADLYSGSLDDVSLWRGALNADEVTALNSGTVGLGLNASDVDALLIGFEAQSSAQAAELTWSYRTDLVGGVGTTGGSIAAGDAFIVLDDSGNGMAAQPPNFSIISVIRGDGETTITWLSKPGAVYIIEFSGDLASWDEVDDSVDSQGDVSTYQDTDPGRVAAPRGYYRVILNQ